LGGGIETRLADIEKRLAALEKFHKVELKDASEEIKKENNYAGETDINSLTFIGGNAMGISRSILPIETNDIVYIVGGERTVTMEKPYTFALLTGYYRCTYADTSGVQIVSPRGGSLINVEYLGESYLVMG